MAANRVLMSTPPDANGETQNLWVLTNEVAKAKSKGLTVVDRARIRVNSPWNTQVVREFPGTDVPENVQQLIRNPSEENKWSAELLSEGDTSTTTPGFESGARQARYHSGQFIKALPALLASRLPGGRGLLGFLARGAAQGSAEAAADIAGRKVAGEKQNIPESLAIGAASGGVNMAFDALSGLPRRIAPSLYGATGVAQVRPGHLDPRMPGKMLAAERPVSLDELTNLENTVTATTDAANQLVQNSGAIVSGAQFGGRIKGLLQRLNRSNLLSQSSKEEVRRMLNTLHGTVGGGVKPFTVGGITANVSVPYKDLSLAQVDEIRRIADNELQAMRQARAARRGKTSSSEEMAWKEIYDESVRAIEGAEPEVARMRRTQHELINQRDAMARALSPGKAGTLYNAIFRVGASPENLSRMAIAMNNPATADVIRTIPGIAELVARGVYYINEQGELTRRNPLLKPTPYQYQGLTGPEKK